MNTQEASTAADTSPRGAPGAVGSGDGPSKSGRPPVTRTTARRARRYQPPETVLADLEALFEASVREISVIEHSRYAMLHRGMDATTRPGRILLAGSGTDFVRRPELVLHEYFHVVRQWSTGRLTRVGYLIESLRRGYWNNRFEVEARAFAKAYAPEFARRWRPERRRDP